jgi:uncharacterized protein (DUF1697 family)
MRKYIAFLRGINIGGKNKIEMKMLKKVFESLGFINVFTYINSGNVIFESEENNNDKLISDIKSGLRKIFDFDIQVIIRDNQNIQKLVKKFPYHWRNDAEQKTDILFLWDEFDSKNSIKLISQTKDVDIIIYCKGAIIWNINRKDYKKSGMNKFIGTALYKNMTARNINTVRKLAELMN